jgi:excisionase family DNA binding protein
MANLMTEDEVSKRLNVSVASLRRWRLLNRGPAFLKVGSLVRYQPEELDAWLASLPTGGLALDYLQAFYYPSGRRTHRGDSSGGTLNFLISCFLARCISLQTVC